MIVNDYCGKWRLIVWGSEQPGKWREIYRRDEIGSEAMADLLGREEVIRFTFRSNWRRLAWTIVPAWEEKKLDTGDEY